MPWVARHIRIVHILLASTSWLCASADSIAAAADDEKNNSPTTLFDSKFTLALGGFFPHIDSTFSLDPSAGGSGQDISVEDDLGLNDTSASAWIGFNWRFLPRHQFHVEWFQLNRDGSTTAGRELDIGDTTAFVGASLSSKIDLNLGRLTYGYSILQNGAGLKYFNLNLQANKSGGGAEFDYQFFGPAIFGYATF